ncbi:hypothetical protein QS430_13355 [Staphylococcus pseudintermedius]|nr:hypothetical protein QS430_13355 [Staphylococcus pseudintermedius]
MSNMTLIVLIVLALVIIWMVTNFIINKRSVTELNQEEFRIKVSIQQRIL